MESHTQPTDSPLDRELSRRIREASTELTSRWLERIASRVAVDPNRIFPTDALLDHMPLLIKGIADFVEDPVSATANQSMVLERAMELGALRYTQGFSEHELLKEYEILGSVLLAFLERVADEAVNHSAPCTPADIISCARRLFQALSVVQQATTSQYVRHMTSELAEREGRLEAFHRALAHEMRNRIGATLGAGQLLGSIDELSDHQLQELAGVVVRNANGMRVVLDNLLELSRVRIVPRQQRHVLLPDAAAEAVRQLRELAERQGVSLRLSENLPTVEVNAAAVELCLVNLISNSVKYADPGKRMRWVEIRGRASLDPSGSPSEVIVEVADNGLGVPQASRERLFERFYRAHERMRPEIEGTGLGLSIVHDTVVSMGGRAWAEYPNEGLVVAFSLPCRRATDERTVEGIEPVST